MQVGCCVERRGRYRMRGMIARWFPKFFMDVGVAVDTEARKDQLALLVRELPI